MWGSCEFILGFSQRLGEHFGFIEFLFILRHTLLFYYVYVCVLV